MSSLTLGATGAALTVTLQGQSLVFGVPVPIGAGEPNDGANIGGAAGEVYSGKVGTALQFRTLEGVGAVVVAVDGDKVTVTAPVYVISGAVNPNGVETGFLGQTYVDGTTKLFYKCTGDPTGSTWAII